jgi:hypothetical protein
MDVDTQKPPRFQVRKVGKLADPVIADLAVLTSSRSMQWNSVCLWSWDIVVDNVRRGLNCDTLFTSSSADTVPLQCAICRNHIMDLCERCSFLTVAPSRVAHARSLPFLSSVT